MPCTLSPPWPCYSCYDAGSCGCKKDEGCFPSHATVEVLGKGAVTMEQLSYGDKVGGLPVASCGIIKKSEKTEQKSEKSAWCACCWRETGGGCCKHRQGVTI
jgi:hypothetical protein